MFVQTGLEHRPVIRRCCGQRASDDDGHIVLSGGSAMSSHPAPAGEADVVVIGGGVLGTAVAARLSRTTASVCLLEAENDVCEGASKGNAGVAVAYYGPPGTPETALINASNPGWEDLCRRLSVPYRRT